MQGSRSLFQTGIKLQGQSASTGISKTRPFLNIWSEKQGNLPTSQSQQKRNMASATTFFDFTPKDSTWPISPSILPSRYLLSHSPH
jgi:hypothetical protein